MSQAGPVSAEDLAALDRGEFHPHSIGRGTVSSGPMSGARSARAKEAPLPLEVPLDMPTQDLSASRDWPRWEPHLTRSIWVSTLISRILLIALVAASTAAFAWKLYEVLQPSRPFPLLIALTILSTICFAWVAFGTAMAVVGAINLWWRGRVDTLSLPRAAEGLNSKTALLCPIYHEEPSELAASIVAISEDLEARGEAGSFDVFVLSDSRCGPSVETDCVLRERAVFTAALTGAHGARVYYRNREDNAGKKAGNVADWVTRFGRGYDHFVILDADSVMSGETLIRLAKAIEAHPRAGLIQTVPRLIGSTTLFARLQQFAHGVYGPVIAAGYAAWQGASGNYWGHNAIIRTRAFAQSAGLPTLNGPPPFGGPIQSHDFVEAAMLRRAGWGVHMVPSADGSFERCPPTLIDMAIRDRRWAQGNLQHLRVVGAPGLPMVSRVHLALGIFSYLASIVWCLALLSGLALTATSQGRIPTYFPAQTETLFPQWPTYNAQAALQLFVATAIVLFLPKLIGIGLEIGESLRRREQRTFQLLAGGLVETLLSILIAPVLMATQIRSIFEIFTGQDSGWSTQNRAGAVPRFSQVWRFHRWHVAIGLVLLVICFGLSWHVAAWMSPIILGLLLSPVLTWVTAHEAGSVLRASLVTRDDIYPPPTVRRVAVLTQAARTHAP